MRLKLKEIRDYQMNLYFYLEKYAINKEYNENDLNTVLKDLYQTNFFSQIKLNIDRGKLLIEVVENPIVEDVRNQWYQK